MFAPSLRRMSSELIKFTSVGVLNTFLCLSVIYSLKWGLDWGDATANLVGYLFCILLGFVLNGLWTFGKSALQAKLLLGYLLVVAVAYLMNLGAVLLSISLLDMSGDYAQLVGVPIFTLISFTLNKLFVFSNTSVS